MIPNSVTDIEDRAFQGCAGFIGNLVIPTALTRIADGAFMDCTGFTGDLVIPNTVITIGAESFSGCSGFDGTLTIGESVESIGSNAFDGCNGFINNLIIPDNVASIGSSAFKGCSGFEGNLFIPDSVNRLGDDAFDGLLNIEKIVVKIDYSDSDTNYKENIISNLPDTSQVIIDMPYDLEMEDTWLETTDKILGKPELKDIVNGNESDLVNNKGEIVSLYIPKILYQESNISVIKDNKPFDLPIKDSEDKYIFSELGEYQITLISDVGSEYIIEFNVYDKEAEDAVVEAEASKDVNKISQARELVNNLPESSVKEGLQKRLSSIFPDGVTVSKKTASSNLDVYIKCENMLSLSVNTTSVAFENYSGVQDEEQLGAVNMTINSSLPYELNAYMPTGIFNADKSKNMPLDILNIKESSEDDYQTFESITDKIVLKDGCSKGNGLNHSIDLKLSTSSAHKADVYKTVIKFEVEQK